MLHLAMVHGAMYDAVNAIDGGYTPYLVSPSATPFDSQDAAAASAAYYVLKSILPSQLGRSVDGVQRRPCDRTWLRLVAVPDGPGEDRGIAVGLAAANAMIAGEDGRRPPRAAAARFTVPAVLEPGDWRPVAPGANDPNGWIRNVTPFMIRARRSSARRVPTR